MGVIYLEKLVITGGTPLKGEVTISGAKNAAVAIIPATLLINGICTINNLPNYVVNNLIILGTNRYPMLGIFTQFKNISINLSLGNKYNKWLKN